MTGSVAGAITGGTVGLFMEMASGNEASTASARGAAGTFGVLAGAGVAALALEGRSKAPVAVLAAGLLSGGLAGVAAGHLASAGMHPHDPNRA